MTTRYTVLPLLLMIFAFALSQPTWAACTQNVRNSLNVRSGPGTHHETIARIPNGSCRFTVATTDCQGNWCKAFYDGTTGWINVKFASIRRPRGKHKFNYYLITSVYEVVAKRAHRKYDLRKSYSQDIEYGTDRTGVRRFYYDNQKKRFIYPGGNGETMCVAAVAETIIEALNSYITETKDYSILKKLPPDHFRARAKARHLRQHLWEYAGLGSKGAAHALERFNIGFQHKFSELTPGDMLKFNRSRAPGHSTIFIAFVDRNGKILERYSSNVAGFRYFSAQKRSGVDLKGKHSNGLGFRTEFFSGKCQSSERSANCRVIRTGRWKPNTGAMLHPMSWGEVGSNYQDELARTVYLSKTGKPIPRDSTIFLNSADGSWLRKEVDVLLEKEMDPTFLGNFEE